MNIYEYYLEKKGSAAGIVYIRKVRTFLGIRITGNGYGFEKLNYFPYENSQSVSKMVEQFEHQNKIRCRDSGQNLFYSYRDHGMETSKLIHRADLDNVIEK